MLLEISKLKVKIKEKDIIKSLDLKVKAGEIHVIMGPNGTGKSTLANVIAGKRDYYAGCIKYKGLDINDMTIDERARKGIFMSFQHPVEIPGVNSSSFLKTAVNAMRKEKNQKEIDALEFLKELREKAKLLNMDEKFFQRSVNQGFSGGEKKKFEILQMLMLEPTLVILDEIDSGLDIDALKTISENINKFSNSNNAIIIITHYQRLLEYITPDFVHIFHDGRIVDTGTKQLALEIERDGYNKFTNKIPA
ncbi:MAG: Fe-S cluster assembly ATPase SufC [Rickettsiales bacterium]|nr:Fe-S cluster assembly ATPase SufC [Rickettsiales bacterium]